MALGFDGCGHRGGPAQRQAGHRAPRLRQPMGGGGLAVTRGAGEVPAGRPGDLRHVRARSREPLLGPGSGLGDLERAEHRPLLARHAPRRSRWLRRARGGGGSGGTPGGFGGHRALRRTLLPWAGHHPRGAGLPRRQPAGAPGPGRALRWSGLPSVRPLPAERSTRVERGPPRCAGDDGGPAARGPGQARRRRDPDLDHRARLARLWTRQ